MKILSLGTYPIRRPKHGGQRRTAALARQHREAGHQILYVAAFPQGAYSSNDASALDLAVPPGSSVESGWASDVEAGIYCAENDSAFRHFEDIANAFAPDVFALEQPFLWPIVERLLTLPEHENAQVVYSSQNVEAPLKSAVLSAAGLPARTIEKIIKATEEVEAALVEQSDLIIAVSKTDAAVYRKMAPGTALVVRPNGIDAGKQDDCQRSDFLPLPYLAFVGSAHLPNRDGFLELIVGDGVQFLPPEKSIAVVGGVSDLIYSSAAFQQRIVSNCDRVHFFSDVSDDELNGLIQNAVGLLLPIVTGGGTNLKTAEALVSGKWVIGTDAAFRGFEEFKSEPGVLIANSRDEFIAHIRRVLQSEPPSISKASLNKRKSVLWSSVLAGFDIAAHLPPKRTALDA